MNPTLLLVSCLTAALCGYASIPGAFAGEPAPSGDITLPGQRYITLLNYRIIDAEYSRSLDRIVSVSEDPNKLHIYDPGTEQETTIDLPLVPSCVSVSPDGFFAAVGHNAWISYVNLRNGRLEKTLAVATDVLDIVLAGNGFAYAFPRRDQWAQLHCIHIATGTETASSGLLYAGTVGRLHPGGKAIYTADRGLSPSDIAKYSIVNGIAEYLYDSPYHGDYAMCGDVWISEDGLRLFTRCGNVFRSSETRSQDMTYNGSLAHTPLVQSIAHSAGLRRVIAVPENGWDSQNDDTQAHVYGYDYLSFEDSIALPTFDVNGTSYPGHGRFVFLKRDGTQFFVILQADASSGMLNDFGIAAFSTDSLAPHGRAETMYFAQFANGDGFVSELVVTNPSTTETANADVSFFGDAGGRLAISLNGQSPAETVSVRIPPLGSVILSTDGTGTLVSGSARVNAALPLGGVIRFVYPGLGIGGVGSSALLSGFVTPVTRSVEQGRNTGVAIASVESGAKVTLILRNRNGEIVSGGQTEVTLNANGHLARFLDQLFPGMNAEFEGTLTAAAADARFIVGTALEVGSKPGEFTTLPVTPLR